jgi:hypothetical protein
VVLFVATTAPLLLASPAVVYPYTDGAAGSPTEAPACADACPAHRLRCRLPALAVQAMRA